MKITEYENKAALGQNDVLLLDGGDGTRTIRSIDLITSAHFPIGNINLDELNEDTFNTLKNLSNMGSSSGARLCTNAEFTQNEVRYTGPIMVDLFSDKRCYISGILTHYVYEEDAKPSAQMVSCLLSYDADYNEWNHQICTAPVSSGRSLIITPQSCEDRYIGVKIRTMLSDGVDVQIQFTDNDGRRFLGKITAQCGVGDDEGFVGVASQVSPLTDSTVPLIASFVIQTHWAMNSDDIDWTDLRYMVLGSSETVNSEEAVSQVN